MQVGNYLQKYQPIIYQTFCNAVRYNHLSHAYLISGNPGTPLLEVAKYLAKSILCDDPSPLACNSCITCMRIDDDNYPDFIVFDGSKETIKKDQVGFVEKQFEKKSFEKKGTMIYVLHLVENMTVEAVNSILKFLEEPGLNIYAFLTTNNENNVLPTIISRCQMLRLKLLDRQQVIDEAISYGTKQSDAELLSYFYNDAELIQDTLNSEDEKDNYESAKLCLEKLMTSLAYNEKRETVYLCQHDFIPQVKSKETARFFIDMIVQTFEDVLRFKRGLPPYLKSYQNLLEQLASSLTNIETSLIEILKCRNIINTNINISLLLDHLILEITKEGQK